MFIPYQTEDHRSRLRWFIIVDRDNIGLNINIPTTHRGAGIIFNTRRVFF